MKKKTKMKTEKAKRNQKHTQRICKIFIVSFSHYKVEYNFSDALEFYDNSFVIYSLPASFLYFQTIKSQHISPPWFGLAPLYDDNINSEKL